MTTDTKQDELKQKAALAALSYVEDDAIIGIGTGSTVNYFIDALAAHKHRIDGVVASSKQTLARLQEHHLPIIDSNSAADIQVYIDGADEVTIHRQLIKGGGGALTGEKILAAIARQFVCIVDDSKLVDSLGTFPLPIEVIPMARSYVARSLVKLGGDPQYREGFISDYGNIILDVYNLKLTDPLALEQSINQITGVVTNGLFAVRRADVVLKASENGIAVLK